MQGIDAGRRLRLLGRVDVDHVQARLPKLDRAAKDFRMADDQRPAPLVHDRLASTPTMISGPTPAGSPWVMAINGGVFDIHVLSSFYA